jgi:hypothetical protein
MAFEKMRAKEAIAQITKSGVRLEGSMLRVANLRISPKVTLETPIHSGEARERGDLDIHGVDFSFGIYQSDRVWFDLWNEIQRADEQGAPFPEISLAITMAHRRAAPLVVVLSGDLVMHLDGWERPERGYIMPSWTGFCSFMDAA